MGSDCHVCPMSVTCIARGADTMFDWAQLRSCPVCNDLFTEGGMRLPRNCEAAQYAIDVKKKSTVRVRPVDQLCVRCGGQPPGPPKEEGEEQEEDES